jgi:hypothetical protein
VIVVPLTVPGPKIFVQPVDCEGSSNATYAEFASDVAIAAGTVNVKPGVDANETLAVGVSTT